MVDMQVACQQMQINLINLPPYNNIITQQTNSNSFN